MRELTEMKVKGRWVSNSFKSMITTAVSTTLALTCAINAPARADVTEDSHCRVRQTTNLPTVEWRDKRLMPKASLVMVHGLSQNGECLRTVGMEIARQGFDVYAVDERGHGYWHFHQSAKDSGYLCDYKDSANDLVTTLRAIRNENPGLPLFCAGESCGAAVIVKAAAKDPGTMDGMILCSTGVKPCRPKLSWLLHDLVFNVFRINHPVNIVRYQRKYGSDNPLDFSEQELNKYVRRSLSLREIFRVRSCVCGTARAIKKVDPRIPITIVQGTEDHTLKPSSAQKVFKNAKTPDKQLVLVPGCGHVMLGTLHPKSLVISTIERFLNRESNGQTVAGVNKSTVE
jgi:alpha-beta hydrolase superfamily lysophospholipase